MTGPVKILLTIRQGKIGGGESHVLELVKNLNRSKFEPIVLSFTDGPMIQTLNSWGVRTHVIYTEKPFNFFVWKKVAALMKSEGVKLVHAHGTRANSNVFYAAKSLNLPLIYTVHGWSFHQDQNFFLRTFRELGERFIVRKSDITICVSKSNLSDGQQRAGVRKYEVINYGIDLEKFNPDKSYSNLREELGVKPEETLVGYIARITIQKDPHTLIRAIAEVAKRTKQIKFLIVGDGDLKASTIQLANELNVTSQIIFLDFRQDTPNVLFNIDIYCLPSLWEGLPIGLLEAMAMRKAIVATPVDGTKEAIVNEQTGILIPHQSPKELADAIIRLHENKNLREQFGLVARKTIEQRFEVKRMAAEVENIYNRFLNLPGKRPLRIGIEAQRLFRKKKHGLEIVALELIRHLQKIDTYNQYVVFVRSDVDNQCIQPTPNFKIRSIDAGSFPEWEQIKLPRAIRDEKIDVLHCTANTAPFFTRVPIVLTLHDVIFLEDIRLRGNYYQNLGNIYRRLNVKRIIGRVKRVLTVSHWEKQQIESHLRLRQNRVQVVYNAVDSSFKPLEKKELSKFIEQHNLPSKFALFFGNTAEKKNTFNTLKGYIKYAEKNNDAIPLVLAGAFDDFLTEQINLLQPSPTVREKIKIIGYIPFYQQPLIYNCATVFLYTSKRESFGLPILESMACGTPVITSNTSSMPEVASDAAHLVDPNDFQMIADAIEKLTVDHHYRDQLIAKGMKRASNFKWENTARELIGIYSQIAQQ